MAALYAKYRDQGFVVLAFPSNTFNQEPLDGEEVVKAQCTRFKAEFPIFKRVDVNGDNQSPLYKFLKEKQGGFLTDNIKWNYTSFICDRKGMPVDRCSPGVNFDTVEKIIVPLLQEGR